MNIKDIVRKHLTDNGYDGMYCREHDCACLADDLAKCCDGNMLYCNPGYKVQGKGGPLDWYISAVKKKDDSGGFSFTSERERGE